MLKTLGNFLRLRAKPAHLVGHLPLALTGIRSSFFSELVTRTDALALTFVSCVIHFTSTLVARMLQKHAALEPVLTSPWSAAATNPHSLWRVPTPAPKHREGYRSRQAPGWLR